MNYGLLFLCMYDLLLRSGHWKQQPPPPDFTDWLQAGRPVSDPLFRLLVLSHLFCVCIFPGTVCVLLFQFPINSAAFKCLYFCQNLIPACFQKTWISMVVLRLSPLTHRHPGSADHLPHAPAWPPDLPAFLSLLQAGETYQPTSCFEQGSFLCGHSLDGYSFLTWFLEL